MARKFHKTVFTFEVLSEEPINDPVSLDTLDYQTTEGHWSGRFLDTTRKVLDGPAAAKALMEQGSDPEFFRLSNEGEDLEDE